MKVTSVAGVGKWKGGKVRKCEEPAEVVWESVTSTRANALTVTARNTRSSSLTLLPTEPLAPSLELPWPG